jgi:hypothetical protein
MEDHENYLENKRAYEEGYEKGYFRGSVRAYFGAIVVMGAVILGTSLSSPKNNSNLNEQTSLDSARYMDSSEITVDSLGLNYRFQDSVE